MVDYTDKSRPLLINGKNVCCLSPPVFVTESYQRTMSDSSDGTSAMVDKDQLQGMESYDKYQCGSSLIRIPLSSTSPSHQCDDLRPGHPSSPPPPPPSPSSRSLSEVLHYPRLPHPPRNPDPCTDPRRPSGPARRWCDTASSFHFSTHQPLFAAGA